MHSPQADLFFTRCSILGAGDGGGMNHFRDDNGYLIVNAQNSEFHGGCLGGFVLSCYFTNCLVDRMLLAQEQGGPGNAFILTNCTFHGGELTLTPNNTPIPIAVRDCAFDGAIITASSYGANSNYANYDYNAFTNTAGRFPIGGTHDVIASNGFNWQSSWFGNYYLPSNSPLITKGDQSAANIGLSHFTTQTSQVPESNAIVDIGYHYVATDASGNPLDTYWLGIPDYLADSNGALGAWEMCYFGHLGLDPNASDGQGNTLLYDYQHALEPTIISFQISFTNQYVNRVNAPLSLAIQSGVPYYWAVLLDNTNFGGASWTAYTSSNITANLGTVQGWHTVWVGLSGRPAGSQAAWNAVRLDLDLTAPILTVTNALSVTIPMIQLQGYANEQLAWLTYDLNNANGSVSNQPGFMTGAIFDTNSFTYTNDSFKCFDLVLASGANTVTLHAADLAGNLTTSNFVFNLNYSNKPAPVVTLWWPQNGAQISGSSFTWRGTVDDPTVTLSAQITDTNGDVNVVAGMIERNGNFWVDNIPLAPGTNWLILTATDIKGNVTSNSIYVVQSSVALNITYIDPITTQSAITVSGTINVTNYTVWVNGVMATNYPWDGTDYPWTAYNVPVNGAGTAVIQASAIPDIPADGNGNGTGSGTNSSVANPGNPPAPDAVLAESAPDKQTSLYCSYFFDNWSGQTRQIWTPNFSLMSLEEDQATFNWFYATGGSTQSNFCTTSYGTNGSVSSQHYTTIQSQWATNGLGTTQVGGSTNAGCGVGANMGPPSEYLGTTSFPCLQGNTVYSESIDNGNTLAVSASSEVAVSQFSLQTGGRSLSGHQSLHALEALAQEIMPCYESVCQDWHDNSIFDVTNIPPQTVTIDGLPQNATDRFVWIVLPDGEDIDVTPKAPSVSFYLCNPLECKYNFVPQCQSPIPTNTIRTNIGVGEYVNFSVVAAAIYYPFSPTLPTNTHWSASAGSPAQTNWPDVVWKAPSNAANVTITTTLPNGQTLNNGLKVLEPTGVTNVALLSVSDYYFGPNVSGAGMYLRVYVAPTNVSFYRVDFMEALTNATSVSNYYSSYYTLGQLMDGRANIWFQISQDNSWQHNGQNNGNDYDRAWWAYDGGPWSPGGGFTWAYSPKWKVGDAGKTNNVPNPWSQVTTLDSDGTVTIQKYGHTVTRNTNNVYTTQQ